MFSYRVLFFSFLVRIDKKDNMLLVMKLIVAMAEHSSIIVVWRNLRTFSDVKTIKHSPNKFDEVLSI